HNRDVFNVLERLQARLDARRVVGTPLVLCRAGARAVVTAFEEDVDGSFLVAGVRVGELRREAGTCGEQDAYDVESRLDVVAERDDDGERTRLTETCRVRVELRGERIGRAVNRVRGVERQPVPNGWQRVALDRHDGDGGRDDPHLIAARRV